jgi:hypothetical protein
MNYELAKELKDAGFPQEGHKVIFPDKEIYTFNEPIHVPTLSELIEACGDCGLALIQTDQEAWEAKSGYDVDDYTEKGEGSTPEEAVARLWLAINKSVVERSTFQFHHNKNSSPHLRHPIERTRTASILCT